MQVKKEQQMSILTNFEYKGVTYEKVVFKLIRAFGSKTEGWNAVFGFAPVDVEFVEANLRGLIHVGVEWSDENPYPILYKAMEKIILKGGFVITPETPETKTEQLEIPAELLTQPVEELPVLDASGIAQEVVETPKKKRTKKVKSDV